MYMVAFNQDLQVVVARFYALIYQHSSLLFRGSLWEVILVHALIYQHSSLLFRGSLWEVILVHTRIIQGTPLSVSLIHQYFKLCLHRVLSHVLGNVSYPFRVLYSD